MDLPPRVPLAPGVAQSLCLLVRENPGLVAGGSRGATAEPAQPWLLSFLMASASSTLPRTGQCLPTARTGSGRWRTAQDGAACSMCARGCPSSPGPSRTLTPAPGPWSTLTACCSDRLCSPLPVDEDQGEAFLVVARTGPVSGGRASCATWGWLGRLSVRLLPALSQGADSLRLCHRPGRAPFVKKAGRPTHVCRPGRTRRAGAQAGVCWLWGCRGPAPADPGYSKRGRRRRPIYLNILSKI